MASVKKTMKSSETKQAKQAKQPGTRSPKTKTSKRSAESKARKAATARALAAKQLAAKKLAAKKLAAKKSALKAKAKVKTIIKTKTAVAVTSRSNSAAKNKKKAPVATRASASGKPPARTTKKAAVAARRGKPALTRATAAKRTAATKPAEAVRKAAGKPARGKLGVVRKAVESKIRAVQLAANGKAAAAALLAFKRNVARLTEARKRAAAAPPIGPAANSSNLSLESNERMTVIKEAKKKISTGTASEVGDTIAPPAKDTGAREASRVGAKGAGTSLHAKTAAKLLVSKAPPPIENQPLAPVAVDAAQLNVTEARPAEKPGVPAPKPVKTGSSQRPLFKPGEFVVYPSHGVGQIVAIEEQEVAGFKLELYVISFIKDKMILKVPTPKAASVGMRKLADAAAVKAALDTLAGRARVKRTMWSRRAQEYEAKINSGDLNAIAEVVRDLYRSDTQPEQSYSERQLYEAALDRMTREIVVVQRLTETESLKVIEAQLQKGPRRGKAEEIDAEAEEAEIEEAA
jgi:CarD family transcriptional regulator